MIRYEYRVHHLNQQAGASTEQQLLHALNHYGHEGWRLNLLYGPAGPGTAPTQNERIHLLFEREKSY